ncbi:unnamed protein product [Aphanomyces euteiches]|uniref:Fe2OG dioxygenase domain-containing protein n=1 Tax=Aphanomyces euteiches TaxID=100861 RepID=A0A6G0XUZ6_9STRA|nr:hypothetical protein Ae201684_000767 [Aphanomyces euteiches]KAH9156333.1 hypothetical protein AeRB84_001764 [Aphanomyces euteiches]
MAGEESGASIADCVVEPSTKKAKLEVPESSVLHPELLAMSAEKRCEIKEKCLTNVPFAHYQLPVLCSPDHMRKVHMECVEELQSTFKETDLFKLYQTIDLGNLSESDPLAKKLPALMQLRSALYSPEFRAFIADITGCDTLTDKVDCAANVYMKGCHLLPHDDVIGTRCVSYVIYLSDPDDEWTAADGGALELYPQETPGIPALVPTAFALPTYNTIALFPVAPGVSFHSVQEVYADKPRLSIQGWFHKKEAPVGVDEATKRQLAAIEATVTPFDLIQADDLAELADAELEGLQNFINGIYLTRSTMEQVQETFLQTGSLQLQDFLIPKWADLIANATVAADKASKLGRGQTPDYEAGYDLDSGAWEPRGPVYHQRYLRLQPQQSSLSSSPKEDSITELLGYLQAQLVHSTAFHKWLCQVTGVIPTSFRSEVRRFRPGLDYTLAQRQSHPILDAVLCLSNLQDEDEEEEGAATGYECYVPVESDGLGDVAAAAADNEDEEPIQIEAQFNTLSLVIRDVKTMKFVKFVGAAARGSRWDLNVEYKLD